MFDIPSRVSTFPSLLLLAAWILIPTPMLADQEPTEATLQAVVRDADGHPVEGALVALVGAWVPEPAGSAVTDAEGRATVKALPGGYGLTVSAPGHGTLHLHPDSFVGEVERELNLEPAGLALSGILRDETGAAIAGAWVRAEMRPSAPGGVYYAITDAEGRYELAMSAGGYNLLILSEDYRPELFKVDASGEETYDMMAPRRLAVPDAVVDWMRQEAVPLAHAAAGNGFEDLQPLRKVIGDARVVSLGEATHGTREFFQLKHRMLEFLVEEMGFTVFAIEANWPEALKIDDYVMGGEGDPKQLLGGLYFWTWNTEEVLEQIEWMRSYNADPENTRKVRFYGFDMQVPHVAATEATAYLKEVDAELGARFGEAVKALATRSMGQGPEGQWRALGADGQERFRAALTEALEHFDAQREAWIAERGERAWIVARQEVVLLQQSTATMSAEGGGYEERDRSMAENVQWILDTEPSGTRAVLWAHNGHVMNAPRSTYRPMGWHLRQALGADDHITLGFAFNQGGFQAISVAPGEPRGLRGVTVGPSAKDHLGAGLARTGLPILALDLRRPASPEVASWLEGEQPMRSIGAVYSGEDNMTRFLEPRASFDVLLFVDETTRARPAGE